VDLVEWAPASPIPDRRAVESSALAGLPELELTPEDEPLSLPARAGRYLVEGVIAVGGVGVVLRARDPELDQAVAVKVLRQCFQGRQDLARRFVQEAQVLAKLQHPGVPPVYEVGALGAGKPFLAMKLIRGDTLAKLLPRSPLPAEDLPRFLAVFGQVCQAVGYAHSRRVIHRDLKPGNIMVGSFGEVQVMDWGFAKVLGGEGPPADEAIDIATVRTGAGERTEVGAVLGTFAYMAHEQARGDADLDARADVFGLGAVLCRILTGQPPFVADTPEATRQMAAQAKLGECLARLDGCGVHPELILLAKRCLAPERADRPADAVAVAEAVAAYQVHVQELLRKAELARQRMRWLTAVLGCALLALATTGLFAWQAQQAKLRRLDAEQGRLEAELAREAEKRQHAIDTALTLAMGADLDGADQAIAEAEQAGASPGQLHMRRGQIALHRGQSRDAIRHLEEAVRLLPDSVAAWGMLAAAHADDGHWERYDKAVQKMERLTPSTPEDFLFKGYAEANLEPARGLKTIKQAFDRRPMMGIALLLRAEVRALVAQDTDNPEEAEGAVQDAKYARELLRGNPAALWVSLGAHLAKAGVHEHRDQPDQRRAELELAGKDADALKPFTALPEAVVYRWLYFREVGKAEEVLGELRQASEQTDHVYVATCYALTLYRRGQPGDLEEALRVLENRRATYIDRLLPFVLAEHDYPDKHDWPARALKAAEDFAAGTQDGAAVMDTQAVRCLLGKKEDAVKANKALLSQPQRVYELRRDAILRCLRYNAGVLSAEELIRDAGRSRWDQCLAHYYVAMTKLAEGDRKGAQEHFDTVIKTRAFLWGPYDLSWVFRARLEDLTWPPWISKGRAK
jgi:tRNA A-37 threonylcarbamoyl transferase component Bud32/tetratricopeptide (TPR) repeat protein